MGERFVVVPVVPVPRGPGVAGIGQPSDAVVADPAPDSGGGPVEEREAGADPGLEPQDPGLPILTYDREPNKYGKPARLTCRRINGRLTCLARAPPRWR
ncbi:hypothetical protein EYF80_067260 [Liparis tanakae]|uniref:Uncharacterized protein n=1 Tax=Liparis tanakae TaxID=230148 RepID=A0A4Z2E190_9TELE|nr:hypothetical protein EYF80_067260 [Liparis tanakae]